jgi:murein DD-endopeptidase MepM/ murein hydrolase activator NlpD
VSMDVAAIIERAKLSAPKPGTAADAPAADREQLKRIAAEFESMLLVQVLKDMRRAGSWEEEGGDTLGAQSLFETLDVELASHLAKVRGLGLGKQLEEAFDRMHSSNSTPNSQPPTPKNPETVLGVGSWELGVTPSASRAGDAVRNHAGASPRVGATDRPAPDVVSVVKAAVKKTAAAVEKTADAIEKTADAPAALGNMLKPVAGAVTSAFGWRRHPITKEIKFHQGVDLRAAYGQEVQAAAAGKVVFSGDQGGYGATVVVEHADGTQTRYAHLSARMVKKGDEVGAGESLGRAGRSGRATGTHLHFEVIAPNGKRIEPERWTGGRNAPLAADRDHGPADVSAVASTKADGGLHANHGKVGKPAVVTMARSIKDSPAGAD